MRDIASTLGVGVGTVGGWLKGHQPRPSVAAQLADYFGVTVEDILDDSRDLPGQKPVVPVVASPVVAAQGASQAGLAQQLREQAAQLLAMAEQLERTLPKPSTLTPMSTAYRPATAAERTEAKAELDDIIRTVEAAEDLPEIRTPVVRRRA